MHGVPLQCASVADMARARTEFRSPRRLGEEINLNATPAPRGTPQRSTPVHALTTARTGMPPSPIQSAPARTLPPMSRHGRRPDEIHVLSSTATSAAAELKKKHSAVWGTGRREA